MYARLRFLFCMYIGALTPLSGAHALNLTMPIGCDYGNNCYISRYFDHESEEPGLSADYTCGALSADGYTSTDFLLEDFTLMERGVPVIAAEAGIVQAVRYNMQDVAVNRAGAEAVRGRECGNGVVINHSRGYSTQYCHLKEQSITVQPGERVEQGAIIAQAGVSGHVNDPNMTFTVFRDGRPVDPFTGEDPVTESIDTPCGALDIYPLWERKTEKRLRYITGADLYTGFTNEAPNAEGARRGKFRLSRMSKHNQFMVYWADMFGVMPGDTIEISIISPDGVVLKHDKRKVTVWDPRYFQRITLRRDTAMKTWPPGTYTGALKVSRLSGLYSNVFIETQTMLPVE